MTDAVTGGMTSAVRPLVRLDGVHVRRGRTDVVRGVDLVVERGEVVAVLGPNGAGKSTLLEAIGGVLPLSSGRISRDGRVASVLQTPGLARRSVRANVELALAWWGVPRSERRERAMEALESMRAEHLARRPADSLSGGECRRVHVARGLALAPDLLLLDEPFAGLDAETRAALCEDTASALRTDQTSSGSGGPGGVMVVLHDRGDAWALADRLVVVMSGCVAASGPPRDLLAAPPSPQVAQFLGYDGRLVDEHGALLTRPTQVVVAPHGDLAGQVARVVALQDGVRAEVVVTRGPLTGRLFVQHPDPDLSVGDSVELRIEGGVRFDGAPASLDSPA